MVDAEVALKNEQDVLHQQKLETLGWFAASLAHDLNNLLTTILAHTTFVKEQLAEQDPTREDVEVVLTACREAASLTGELLSYVRGRSSEPERVDLNELVVRASPLLRRVAGVRATIHFKLTTGIPSVCAVPHRLLQVLVNLVLNARDAMLSGGLIVIETDAGNVTANPSVALRVRDGGEGMDEATRAKALTPFFTTKRKGTGIGLSMAAELVRAWGGELRLDSQLGQGTTVEIILPAIAPLGTGRDQSNLFSQDIEIMRVFRGGGGASEP